MAMKSKVKFKYTYNLTYGSLRELHLIYLSVLQLVTRTPLSFLNGGVHCFFVCQQLWSLRDGQFT